MNSMIYNGDYQDNWIFSSSDYQKYLDIFITSHDYDKIKDAFVKLIRHIPGGYFFEVPKCENAAEYLSGGYFSRKYIYKLLDMFENRFIPAVNLRLKNEQSEDENSKLNDLLKELDTYCNCKLSPFRSSSNLKFFEEVKYEHFYFLFLEELLRRTYRKTSNNENSDTFHNKLDLLSKKLVIYLESEKYQNYLLRLAELSQKGEVPKELSTNLQSDRKK